MARIRADYVFGTTTAALGAADTTLSSAELSRLPAVTAPDVAAITLHDGTDYEIVHVTAHTASATTATILRGQEGTTGLAWASGAEWTHGLTVDDTEEFAAGGVVASSPTAALEPTAPLVDYTPDAGIINVAAGATHAAFPFTCTLRSGKHLVQYRTATDHDWVSDGAVKLKSSTDDGATWSAAWTMVDNATEDDNGGGLVQLRDGTVLGLIVRRPTATQTGWYSQSMRSTDEGATWDTPVTLNAGASGFEYATHVVALDNGDVLAFLYCNNGGDDYVVVMASTDGGDTWASRGSITGSAGQDYQEPQAVVMPDGEILVFMRYASGATGEVRMARSVDNGATWTTPTAILTQAGGQPAPHLTPNGLLVVAYRDLSTAALKSAWATSADRGNTWTTRGNFTGSDEVYVYAGWLNLSDGDVMCVYGLESLLSDYVGDTYAMRFARSLDTTVPLDTLDASTGSAGDVLTKVGSAWVPQAPTGGGGGGTAGRVLLSEQVLGSAAASITFTSAVVPTSGYKHIEVELLGRSSQAAATTGVNVQINGDTTAGNYTGQRVHAEGSSSFMSSATANQIGYIAGDTAAANAPGTLKTVIPDFLGTTWTKVLRSESYAPASRSIFGTTWANTAAVTQVALLAASGNFKAGTVARLYGIV